jgi:hypothetical protein
MEQTFTARKGQYKVGEKGKTYFGKETVILSVSGSFVQPVSEEDFCIYGTTSFEAEKVTIWIEA